VKAVRRVRKKAGYHHGDLRRALTDAALQLIEKQGAGAVTLREVARMAGVSHQAPYRHFADRSELLAAVAEDGFRALHAEMVKAMQQAPDSPAAFRVAGVSYVVFAVKHPAHFRVMFGADAAACRGKSASLDAACEALAGILTRGVAEAKRGVPGANDTMDIALAAWSLVHGLASLLVEGQLEGRSGGRTPRELAELVTGTVKFGLSPKPNQG
jgi:AcrR family transcriptional regulator